MSLDPKLDIVNAASGTDLENYIAQAMRANPGLIYKYIDGESFYSRSSNILFVNNSLTGGALLGSAAHELRHVFDTASYSRYEADARTAIQTGSLAAMVSAMVNNEARITAASVLVADPNKYAPGYISSAQANAAMTAALSAGPVGSQAYMAALSQNIADAIRQDARVMNKIEIFSVDYLGISGVHFLAPPEYLPPFERIVVMSEGDFLNHLRGMGDLSFSIDIPSGTFDQFGNWFSWDGNFVDLVMNDIVDSILNGNGVFSGQDSLSYEVEQSPSGSWKVDFTAQTGYAQSTTLERVRALGTPHGMGSFLSWFQSRTEEMARDMVIVSRAPNGEGDRIAVSIEQAELVDDAAVTNRGPVSGDTSRQVDFTLPTHGYSSPSRLDASIASANALVESLAMFNSWSGMAANIFSADSQGCENQARFLTMTNISAA